MKMSKDYQRTSLITALAMCSRISEEGQRHRSTGTRARYSYSLPLVGSACRTAFQTVFNVSNDASQGLAYRNEVKAGEFALPAHGNIGNKHAQSVDETALKGFFTRLAETHGDIVPVRFRYQQTVEGSLQRNYTVKEYRMLPSYFTWEMMLGWYVEWAKDARVHFKDPSLTSFRTILERSCPNIRIRSPRDKGTIIY
ncbi:hypothetical protein PHMEG_00028154 [Phytophthora megakarya]|uniref:Uncharacterized protein n=1 Tax=Phytophthora megakarya TaxID=4795 RepID=A0A225V5K4_9STRA|nr:hypothetical protein PHMEG_00028154 [Phytophthora megakarya]